MTVGDGAQARLDGPDTVGQAHTGTTSLSDAFAAWQESILSYGNDQGFTVSDSEE